MLNKQEMLKEETGFVKGYDYEMTPLLVGQPYLAHFIFMNMSCSAQTANNTQFSIELTNCTFDQTYDSSSNGGSISAGLARTITGNITPIAAGDVSAVGSLNYDYNNGESNITITVTTILSGTATNSS